MTGVYPKPLHASMPMGIALVAAGLAGVMALTDLGGGAWRSALWLETGSIWQGQLWRLVTAHLVNLSRVHTYLNIAGLGLILITLWTVLTPGRLTLAIAASGGAISLGWVLLMPPDVSYVGFSGITHGVLAYGGLLLLRSEVRWFGALVLGCLLAKLAQEYLNGAVPGADAAIGGRVSFVSHALGSLGGVLAAARTPVWLRAALVVLCLWLAVEHAAREQAQIRTVQAND